MEICIDKRQAVLQIKLGHRKAVEFMGNKNYYSNGSPQNMIKVYKHQEQLLDKKIKSVNSLK